MSCFRVEGNLTEKVLVIFCQDMICFSMGFFSLSFFLTAYLESSTSCQISASLWFQLVYHPPLCFIHIFFSRLWWATWQLLLLWCAIFSCVCIQYTSDLKTAVFLKWQLSQMKGNMVSRESAHYQTLVLCNWMSWISKDQYTRGLCPYTHTFNGCCAL